VDSIHLSWTTKAEAAIRTLRDVEGASIQADGGEVREVHVLTSSKRPAKQIVRDVQTLLLTRFNQPIDHRVVSVAYTDPVTRAPDEGRAFEHGEAETADDARSEAAAAIDRNRIRFVSANVYVSGPRVQAQVELKWNGRPRMGSASGWSTRDGAHRLVANATIAAIQEYLHDGMALSLEGIELLRLGRQSVVVVALELLAHREHKVLIGCCSLGKDRQQATVLATLSAVNRVFGGLPVRETSSSN
jgi:hypothetical protein